MKHVTIFTILLSFLVANACGQDFSVPDAILNDMKPRAFDYTRKTTFDYKVVYPPNYDKTKKYPVCLGLSGGNSSENIVNYCYYLLFKTDYLKDYIVILPLGPEGRTLSSLDKMEIDLLITDIQKKEKVESSNWLVAGTSMGGLASFNFAAARPELFGGIITFPGGMEIEEVPAGWKDYTIVLAVGEKEEANWKGLIEATKVKLAPKVKRVKTFVMKGQGHMVSRDYDIGKVYQLYFDKSK